MRKIILIMSVFLFTACISEIKPILRPAEVDIPTRIANQQKWLAQDVAAKIIVPQDAAVIKGKLKEIKEKYDRLQSAGVLTARDSDAINKMLDKSSELLFVYTQKRQSPVGF